MNEAERICGCRPWDYPRPLKKHPSESDSRICDFYGSSCFNSIIENGLAQSCHTTCLSGCNETIYTISMEKEGLDENKICNPQSDFHEYDLDLVDIAIQRHITSGTTNAADSMLRRFQEATVQSKNTSTFAQSYCKQKMMYDVAVVDVVINTPTVLRYVQNRRVTVADKLANFGR